VPLSATGTLGIEAAPETVCAIITDLPMFAVLADKNTAVGAAGAPPPPSPMPSRDGGSLSRYAPR